MDRLIYPHLIHLSTLLQKPQKAAKQLQTPKLFRRCFKWLSFEPVFPAFDFKVFGTCLVVHTGDSNRLSSNDTPTSPSIYLPTVYPHTYRIWARSPVIILPCIATGHAPRDDAQASIVRTVSGHHEGGEKMLHRFA